MVIGYSTTNVGPMLRSFPNPTLPLSWRRSISCRSQYIDYKAIELTEKYNLLKNFFCCTLSWFWSIKYSLHELEDCKNTTDMGHIQTCVLASTFFVTYVRKRIDCEIHLMLEARQLHMLRDISHLFKFISVQGLYYLWFHHCQR